MLQYICYIPYQLLWFKMKRRNQIKTYLRIVEYDKMHYIILHIKNWLNLDQGKETRANNPLKNVN